MTTKSEASYARLKCCFSRKRQREKERERERERERDYNYRCCLKQRLLFLFRSKYTGFDTAHLFERIKQQAHEKD